MKFFLKIFIIFLFFGLMSACSNIPPSESLAKDYLIDDVKLYAEVMSFKKLDGVLGESDGIKNYTMDYEAELKILAEKEQNIAIKEFKVEVEKSSDDSWKPWESIMVPSFAEENRKELEKKLPQDRLIKVTGKIFFSRTENGWHFVAATENF